MTTIRAILGVCILATATAASAQTYPDRAVKVIVPYTAGGGTDTVARAISQRLSEKWGQPVVVENRPGAGTTIGTDSVVKSAPDGYTLLFSDSASFVINPHIYEKLAFDPRKDLEPIALTVHLAPVLAVSNEAPGKTVTELLAAAKASPGKLTYASPGVGSYPHVAMEYLKHLAGVDIQHIPYKGSAAAVTDLIAGRLTMYMVTYSVFEGLEKEGKLRVIGSATEKRIANRPDLPTISETVKDYTINVWFGFAAPKGTPAAILDKIHNDISEILKQPDFIEQVLKPQTFIAGNLTRSGFADLINSDHEKWKLLVKISNAKIQ